MKYDSVEKVVIKSLKSDIKRVEKYTDKQEKPGEGDIDLASLYRVLEYYSYPKDYNSFVKKRMAKRNKKGK